MKKETQKKLTKVGSCVSLVLFVALVTLFSLPAVPSSEMATSPTTRINTVFRDLGGLKTAYTRIDTLTLNDNEGAFAWFSDTGQTLPAEVGTVLTHPAGIVFISKDHATSAAQASDYTRLTVTIKNPAGGTIFTESLYSTAYLVIERANYYEVAFGVPSGDLISHTLVEGTYTVTAEYEIYT